RCSEQLQSVIFRVRCFLLNRGGNGCSVADGVVRRKLLSFRSEADAVCRSGDMRVPDVHAAVDHPDLETTTRGGGHGLTVTADAHRLASVIKFVVVSLFR